ncbi:MAG: hypothetical protein DMF89_06770 [Acidobacteria bacterium]|nr:MAG: hypothetical protein DMF89_06770 [Acidobacteriota bacterium]
MIGLSTERHDTNGEGPDVLWLLPSNVGLVLLRCLWDVPDVRVRPTSSAREKHGATLGSWTSASPSSSRRQRPPRAPRPPRSALLRSRPAAPLGQFIVGQHGLVREFGGSLQPRARGPSSRGPGDPAPPTPFGVTSRASCLSGRGFGRETTATDANAITAGTLISRAPR